MKLLLIVLLAAPAVLGGYDVCSKAAYLKEKCEQPICKCDELKACVMETVAKKEEKIKGCMASCQASNPVEGVDFAKLEQCHAAKKEAMKKAHECFDAELPKSCDEGSGVTELPIETKGGKKHRGKKGKKMDPKKMIMKLMKKFMPEKMQAYFKCVKKCGKGGKGDRSGGGSSEEGHRRFKRGGHHGLMKCAKKLKCRKARTFDMEKKKEVMKKCLPPPPAIVAGLIQTCQCGKEAGVDVDCAAIGAAVGEMMKKMGPKEGEGPPPPEGRVKRDMEVPHPDPNIVCFQREDVENEFQDEGTDQATEGEEDDCLPDFPKDLFGVQEPTPEEFTSPEDDEE